MTTTKRCGSCLGLGYKGRWVPAPKKPKPHHGRVLNGRVWKIGTCHKCGGRGERSSA